MVTEFCPSILIAYFLTKVSSKKIKKQSSPNRMSANGTTEKISGVSQCYAFSDDELQDEDVIGFCKGEMSSDEDSFGDFNPNFNNA